MEPVVENLNDQFPSCPYCGTKVPNYQLQRSDFAKKHKEQIEALNAEIASLKGIIDDLKKGAKK